MKLFVQTMGVFLLGICPAGLSAQVVYSSGSVPSSDGVSPVVYQAPAASQRKVGGAAPSQGRMEAAPSLPPLKPRASTNRDEPGKQPGGLRSLLTVGGSLVVVLAIFFAIVWLLRRAAPRALGTLPNEAFEVLGRAPLTHHQQVHLLRCGNRLLLVSVGAAGAATLAEISDPAEVDRLTGLCRQTRPSSAAGVLRQVFRQAEDQHA